MRAISSPFYRQFLAELPISSILHREIVLTMKVSIILRSYLMIISNSIARWRIKKALVAHLLIQIHHFAGEEFPYLVLRNRDIEGMSSAFKSKNQVVVRI